MARVFLVGFMAAGKTTVGAQIAEKLGRPFFDVDQIICEREGRSVVQIFENLGERAFRELEANALAEIVEQNEHAVVATGGGAMAQPGLAALMDSSGLVIHLDVSESLARSRLESDNSRPLAGEKNRVSELYLERQGAYKQARVHITVDGKHPFEIAHEAEALIKKAELLKDETGSEFWLALGHESYALAMKGGLLDAVGPRLRALQDNVSSVAIISDANVAPLYLSRLEKSICGSGLPLKSFVIPAGEGEKTLARYAALSEELVGSGLDRQSAIISLGGGVIGDLAGFVASTLFRGVSILHVPTTLLAMIDASIGGKSAVNSKSGKNLIGSFWQPLGVVIDPQVLSTLPPEHLRSGFGEMLKTALLDSPELFDNLEAHLLGRQISDPVPTKLIEDCARLKARIVGRDPRERGERMVLNLGHTVAHAIEANQRFGGIQHGEAVGLGLVAACLVSEELGLLGQDLRPRLVNILKRIGMAWELNRWIDEEALQSMNFDKKRKNEKIVFIALQSIGQPVKVELSLDRLKTILLS